MLLGRRRDNSTTLHVVTAVARGLNVADFGQPWKPILSTISGASPYPAPHLKKHLKKLRPREEAKWQRHHVGDPAAFLRGDLPAPRR